MSEGMSQVQMDLYTPAPSNMAFQATIARSNGLFKLVLHAVKSTGLYRPPALLRYESPRGLSRKVHRRRMKTSTLTSPNTCNATYV